MQLTINASCVVVDSAGRVLLVKREDLRMWAVPGGGAEQGESPMQTARRETKEESGIDAEITALIGVYTAHKADFLTFVYQAHPVGGTITRSFESVDVRYFAPDALPDRLMPTTDVRLADALAQRRGVLRHHPLPRWMHVAIPVFLRLRRLRNRLAGRPEMPAPRRDVLLQGALDGHTIVASDQPQPGQPAWAVLRDAAERATSTRVTADRVTHVDSSDSALVLHIALSRR